MSRTTQLETYYRGPDIARRTDHVTFKVNTKWLTDLVRDRFDTTLEEFLDSYTWDDSLLIRSEYEKHQLEIKQAKLRGV